MEKNFIGDLTAQNATETNKTLVSTILVPQGVTKLVEVGAMIASAGYTTLESVGFILELECDDSSSWGGTQQFASDVMIPVLTTSGAANCMFPSKIHDCNIPVQAGSHIKCSTTFNVALTINPSLRPFGKFV
jgi:hypothetical protein